MYTNLRKMFWLLFCLFAGLLLAIGIHAAPILEQTAQAGDSLRPALAAWEPMEAEATGIGQAYGQLSGMADSINGNQQSSLQRLEELIALAEAEKSENERQRQSVDELVQTSGDRKKLTSDTLDQVLSSVLGDPVGQTFGKRATIKVYSLKEAGYRGYMAKVKLHDPSAIKLVLSHDKIGVKGETTSAAAARTGAKLAINAGGFATQDGVLYPIGITVVDGEIRTFYRTDLSFIGFDKAGKLVGGEIKTREEIAKLNIMQGASFVPTLLKDGKKMAIPQQWRNKKEPRTLIGSFSNGDLLFIVIDGRQKGYSNGVTLEEAQDKLLEFKVRDAYNLDGGGSSTFYYNGKVLNRPSDGRERPVASNFVLFP